MYLFAWPLCIVPPSRVLALKALCDIRCDREDMRSLLDDTLNPSGAKKAKAPPPPAAAAAGPRTSSRRRGGDASATPEPPPFNLTAEEVHGKVPLGVDAAGAAYYWFDMPFEHGQTAGVVGSRIYKSGPPEEGKEEDSQQLQQQGAQGVSSSSLPPKVPLR